MAHNTDSILKQQDCVDGTIYDTICILVGREVPWDIEVIGGVRDVILFWLGDHNIAEPDDIYPSLVLLEE